MMDYGVHLPLIASDGPGFSGALEHAEVRPEVRPDRARSRLGPAHPRHLQPLDAKHGPRSATAIDYALEEEHDEVAPEGSVLG